MIERVLSQAQKALLVNFVVVATDDIRIYEAVHNFGGEVVMTRSDHPTGTDRLLKLRLLALITMLVNVKATNLDRSPDH